MANAQDIRRNAEKFVQQALEDAQSKQPTKKAIKQAVDRIVQNCAPLTSSTGSSSHKSNAVTFD